MTTILISAWLLTTWSGPYFRNPVSESFSVPQSTSPFVVMLSSTQAFCGDLGKRTIQATFTISGDGEIRFGGQGRWNTGTLPANVRIFISSHAATYTRQFASIFEDQFWWSANWAPVTNGTQTISASAYPAKWSNANGHWATNRLEGWKLCLADVRQIGLSFGGGSFAETGIAVTNGAATFTLDDFQTVVPETEIAPETDSE